jgi:hypothetical protein
MGVLKTKDHAGESPRILLFSFSEAAEAASSVYFLESWFSLCLSE